MSDLRDKIARALKVYSDSQDTPEEREMFGDQLTVEDFHGEADAVLAVLDAETEWEYSYVSNKTGNRWGSGSLMDAQLGSEALDAHVERRRKASPWEPVPEGEER